MLNLQTTEGLNMTTDEKELFYGRMFLVEKVSCEWPCGPALHLTTGLCFSEQKEPTTALCNGKVSRPLLFYSLFRLSSLPDFTLLSSVNKLQPKWGSACV